ncbi:MULTISPECIES: flavin-containing monooxygenase [unclassified Sphingomonas]|uniref:flavin-containing monooxygenase n=1 Tax=unclassified Sphingomonas TaxID=196159 RepID=UPI0006F6F32F|nr:MULTISPECIES: NAD(P)/FAD-dependent oxidoreductase [unclassified Sphingomonas]KQX18611.1 hypothetical protein ASD17_15850 [Sphingomonas sp. Root1294]KQY72066.1 hypothetical protein ASD39_19125 [Sphingomonas sp. Root50]KRB94665.1 hypothetical protein ASE22_01630 [Sphingomonas sp. Root720]
MIDSGTKPEVSEAELEAARAKYAGERDKRLRSDGEGQYIQASGEYARFNDLDPYIQNKIVREPMFDEVQVAILGGGFTGLLMGAQMRNRGLDDFRIFEAASDFGGAWYWNRYPGAQCDIEGYIYLPLLEETGYVPRIKYSFAAEIFEHCQRVARQFNLYEKALLQTRVTRVEWQEDIQRWIIHTGRGDRVKAQFVVMGAATGKPKLPGIPGIGDFKGTSFHTSHWDYGFTGGNPNAGIWDVESSGGGATGKLDKLADKKVAVIGTGATAIQCIPYLARDAKEVYVFQRTPNAVALRGGNPVTSNEFIRSLEPGWQKERRINFEKVVSGHPLEDLVNDCWTDMLKKSRSGLIGKPAADVAKLAEINDYLLIKEFHDQMEEIVQDKQVCELLKPWYRPGCKRPGFNDEYLAAFNRPNLHLVDVAASKGVDRITETGLVANGKAYDVDLIVFATGFEITIQNLRRGMDIDVVGRDGISLYDHWGDGLKTLHGHSTVGFPNFFYVGFSQNAFAFNQGLILDEQTEHVSYIIEEVLKRGAEITEVEPGAEAQWVSTIRDNSRLNREFLEACTPGYYNNEGALRGGVLSEAYSPGIIAFLDLMAEWRAAGDLQGFKLS